jgi:hypothetical protein
MADVLDRIWEESGRAYLWYYPCIRLECLRKTRKTEYSVPWPRIEAYSVVLTASASVRDIKSRLSEARKNKDGSYEKTSCGRESYVGLKKETVIAGWRKLRLLFTGCYQSCELL